MHCRRFAPLEGPREERPGLKNPPSARSGPSAVSFEVPTCRLCLGPLPSAPPAGMRLLQDGELLLGARLGSLDGLPRLCPRRWACPTSATMASAPDDVEQRKNGAVAGRSAKLFENRLLRVHTPSGTNAQAARGLWVGSGRPQPARTCRRRSTSRQRRCTLVWNASSKPESEQGVVF